jgi:hypothetical protein
LIGALRHALFGTAARRGTLTLLHPSTQERRMPSEQHEKNIETGQQGTHEPWKKPGQASQDTSPKVPKKEDRQGTFDQVNQTS